MTEPRIAATLVDSSDIAISLVEPVIDFWEVRMDLIGPAWLAVVKKLRKPWIACNRRPEENGRGQADESIRIEELLRGIEQGAAIVDIELGSPRLEECVRLIKKHALCLISYHNFRETPDYAFLNGVVQRESQAGADICKIVTTARIMQDNLTLLKLIKDNPELRMVAFAMGAEGRISRILAPLAGAYFTFASLERGKESASGQLPAAELKAIYTMVRP